MHEKFGLCLVEPPRYRTADRRADVQVELVAQLIKGLMREHGRRIQWEELAADFEECFALKPGAMKKSEPLRCAVRKAMVDAVAQLETEGFDVPAPGLGRGCRGWSVPV